MDVEAFEVMRSLAAAGWSFGWSGSADDLHVMGHRGGPPWKTYREDRETFEAYRERITAEVKRCVASHLPLAAGTIAELRFR